MNVLFFGSDGFAVEPLERMLESGHRIVSVVGRPDAPAGRGLLPAATPVVRRARELGLPLLQPQSLDRVTAGGMFLDLEWEVGVVVAYGNLIPGWLLGARPRGFVNLHPSLLPRFRGAAPVERAIMNGATITGVTTILMNERLDAGDLLMHHEEPIYDDDTAGTLRERLSSLGARLLAETLEEISAESVRPVPQEEDKATFAPVVAGAEGNINWGMPAEKIDRLVRALDPEQGAYTFFRGKRLKIWSVHLTDVPPEDEPGTLMSVGKEDFLVNTGTNCVLLASIQPEGKPRMSSGEFSRGQRLLVAERFTSER